MTYPGRASRAPEWERTESVIEDILRWADDGGKMPDPGSWQTRSRTAGSNPDAAQERTDKRMLNVRGKVRLS